MFKVILVLVVLGLGIEVVRLNLLLRHEDKMVGYLAHNYSLLNMTCLNNCHAVGR